MLFLKIMPLRFRTKREEVTNSFFDRLAHLKNVPALAMKREGKQDRRIISDTRWINTGGSFGFPTE
jgi:hypothetical protein